MPKWNKPPDIINRLKKVEKKIYKVGTGIPYDPTVLPGPPQSVVLEVLVREKKANLLFRGRVTWGPPIIGACHADVHHYEVQIRPQNAAGDVIAGEKRTRKINAAEFEDGEGMYANFGTLDRPKKWRWQARVRAVDKALRNGLWSAWTAPILPFQEGLPKPPIPTGVALSFDQVEKKKWDRNRAIVAWDEVGPWDIPGFDEEDDVSRYAVQLRVSDAAGNFLSSVWRTKKVEADPPGTRRAVFAAKIKKNRYYRARVRSIDRFNRRGDWSAWTPAGTAADDTPPPAPLNVVATSGIQKVIIEWESPLDPDDATIIHEDIAYYQVQASKKKGFSPIWKRDRYVGGERKQFHSKDYKSNHWLRVRSVDASGNKSAWVMMGPVHSLKASAASANSFTDVDFVNEEGVELVGATTNRGYLTSVTANAHAWIDGEVKDGTLTAEILLSPTTDRGDAGVMFRGIDATNYLYVRIRKIAGANFIGIRKMDAGVESNLAETTGNLVNGQTYEVKVVCSGNLIEVYIDGVLRTSHTLLGANSTKYNAANALRAGLWMNRSATNDDGGSKFDYIEWYDPIDDTWVFADSFERADSTTSLGMADSEQIWTAQVGTWGISPDAIPRAVQGTSLISPLFYAANTVTFTENIPTTGSAPYQQTILAVELYNAVKILCWVVVEVSNPSGTTAYTLSFRLNLRLDGVDDLGTNTRMYMHNDDRRRILTTMRHGFLIPTGNPSVLNVNFSYNQTDTSARPLTIYKQRLMVGLFYAPDVAVGKTPNWTKSAITRVAYKGGEAGTGA